MSCVLAALVVFSAGSLDDVAAGAGDGAVSGGEASRVIYVHAEAMGANDGSSWGDAFCDLQDALAVAEHGDEIWVAAGVYKPDRGTGDPWMSFELVDGVELYGGFAGYEAHRHQRDSSKNETILSGDLAGNDDFDEVGESGCCRGGFDYVCDDQVCRDAVCDTFGPSCCLKSWWREDCAFSARFVCPDLCRPARIDNTQSIVTAIGPGLFAILDGFTIAGAEVYRLGTPPSPTAGSALFSRDAIIAVRNCIFRDNASLNGSGGLTVRGEPEFIGCVFRENYGRALSNAKNDVIVADSRFEDNPHGGLRLEGFSLVKDSHFIRNGITGLVINRGVSQIIDTRFKDNTATTGGASIVMFSAIAQFINCDFIGNVATMSSGAISNSGALSLVNCVLVGNRAGGFVGSPGAKPRLGVAGAVDNAGVLFVLNSTVFGNHAGIVGGIATGPAGFTIAQVENAILWGNTDDLSNVQAAQLSSSLEQPPIVRYSVIQGWTGSLGGVGNSGIEPGFVDPVGPDGIPGTGDENLRLGHSLLKNRGDPNPAWLPPFDRDYRVRTLCGRVDIGAYEFGFGDFNCDRVVEVSEVAENWPFCHTHPDGGPYPPGCEAFDSDADGDVDLFDFAAMQNELSRLAVP